MSHYLCLVLIEQDKVSNTQDEIRKLLAPYNENLQVEPHKVYLDASNLKNIEKYQESGKDGTGSYYLSIRNPKAKWDYYTIGGLWNEVVAGNLCPVRDLPENIRPYAIITPDGEWHSEDEDTKWPGTFLMILGNHTDCLAVWMDLHT